MFAQHAVGLPQRPIVPIATLFEALDKLVRRVYGVELHCEPTGVGETDDPAIFKVVVLDSASKEPMGDLYCDLFARPGKDRAEACWPLRTYATTL